jgi:hypothetical protein
MKIFLSVVAIVAILATVTGLLFAYVGFFSGIGAVVLLLIGFAYALDSGALAWLFPNNAVSDNGGELIEGEWMTVEQKEFNDPSSVSNYLLYNNFLGRYD